jgi:hypothetical protein
MLPPIRKLNISKRIKISLVDVAINFYLMTDRSIAPLAAIPTSPPI